MPQRTHEFLVKTQSQSQIHGPSPIRHYWFQVLGDDPSAGQRLRIPARQNHYTDPDVWNVIQQLEERMVVSATVERPDKTCPWTPTEIEIIRQLPEF